MQIGAGHARGVAGVHRAVAGACPAEKKILHPLAGSQIPTAPCLKGLFLQPALKGNACKRVAAAKILRGDIYQQCAVDVFPAPGIFAHAVGDGPALLRRGGHHLSAGADAEGESAAAIGQMAGQLVGADRQGRMPCVFLILNRVNLPLEMLDAHAHGKRLWLHENAPRVKPLHRVPRTVAGGKD